MDPKVEVRRSRRRRRTVSAYREGDTIVVLIPATMSRAQEAEWVKTMVARLAKKAKRAVRSDEDLVRRASELSDLYLGGLAAPDVGALGGEPEVPLGLVHAERQVDQAVVTVAADALVGGRLRAGP